MNSLTSNLLGCTGYECSNKMYLSLNGNKIYTIQCKNFGDITKWRPCSLTGKALFHSMFKMIVVTLNTKFSPLLEILDYTRTHLHRYFCYSSSVFKSATFVGLFLLTFCLQYRHRKKSRGFMSGERRTPEKIGHLWFETVTKGFSQRRHRCLCCFYSIM